MKKVLVQVLRQENLGKDDKDQIRVIVNGVEKERTTQKFSDKYLGYVRAKYGRGKGKNKTNDFVVDYEVVKSFEPIKEAADSIDLDSPFASLIDWLDLIGE